MQAEGAGFIYERKVVSYVTKLEKDTVIDAILIFHKLAKNDEEFLAAVETFRNEKATTDHLRRTKEDD